MPVKLIALDMDGTLLRDDHATISERNRNAMKEAIRRGIWVVPASGRTRSMLPPVLTSMEGIRYVLTSNGAVVVDLKENRELYANRIATATVQRLLPLLASYQVIPQVYLRGSMLVDRDSVKWLLEQPLAEGVRNLAASNLNPVDSLEKAVSNGGVEKITINYIPAHLYQSLWQDIEAIADVVPVSSIQGNIEINSKTANKGDGLIHLCRAIDVPLDQTMAVGDAGNDVEMLQAAGVSVAMGNAFEAARAAARYVTATNEEDGVALAIERYAFCEQNA